ncbi:MAG: glycosyltransferase family 4 protein [Bacteroidota bacterium]
MSKKKILFMVQVPPPVHGAALRNLSLVESKLLRENFDIKLLSLAFAESIEDIGKVSGSKLLKALKYAVKLVGTLISFKPAVAYFTLTPAGGAFYRDCLFVLILKIFRIRIVYHLRGLGINAARKKNFLNRLLYGFAFSNTNVVCLSKKHLEDIEGLRYKDHFVVPNGIRVEMKPELLSPNGSDDKKILFLSNFVRSKGVYEFLEAVRVLKLQGTRFKATLVGADYDVTLNDIQAYIDKYDLNDRVSVKGPLYKEEKFKMIANCDIFVFPTYYTFELFPGVILEAMQCSKPVISTYHGVIEDIVDDGVTGLLVKTQNVEQLVEKINYLINTPEEAKALGRRAFEKFHHCYTLDKFEQNMKSVFEKV